MRQENEAYAEQMKIIPGQIQQRNIITNYRNKYNELVELQAEIDRLKQTAKLQNKEHAGLKSVGDSWQPGVVAREIASRQQQAQSEISAV